MTRKITAPRCELIPSKTHPGNETIICENITCEVTGEMSDGSKVWTDIKTGKQYFCFRILGKYGFVKM